MKWQVQEAKQRFSQLVQRALDEGPQTVTRHGDEVVVVLSKQDYQRLAGQTLDFKDFLLAAPDLDQLDIRRSADRAPTVEL